MKLRFALLLALAGTSLHAENEIGFIEKFALAADRTAVLGQLIPGSEEYYFFHALHFQNTRQAAPLREILNTWAQRYPHSAQRKIIENRAALLSYDADPQATLKFLRERLNVDLNHERIARDQKPDLPSKLDPASVARSVFQEEALLDDDLNECTELALETLVRTKANLNAGQVRALLSKITRPDVPNLVDLIEANLKTRESRGFGEFPIHGRLLSSQLDELVRRQPKLAENQAFVNVRLKQLLPGADANATFDATEREAWLDRAWAYVSKLPPVFNTLKAQVLRQRLEHDLRRGVYDKARFLTYLQLPRRTNYMNPRYIDQPELIRFPVDLNAHAGDLAAILPPIGNDESLVRAYLLELFKTEDTREPWAVWLRDTYVKPLFAESKIVNGLGNPEQWASLLSPSAFQALKDRVDVDFTASVPQFFAPADEVKLDLLVKNVPRLIVKVYEINALSFFLTQKRQLNTDLNLDGLVANRETTHDLSAEAAGGSPFRRIARSFDFPELKGRRGAWIIEFIGGGKSSRALIRKGQWEVLQQTGPAGDLLTVIDENRQPVKDAAVWLDGRKFTVDPKTGFVHLPFTTQPGMKPVILADAAGEFATLAQFDHHAESYRLDAQFHIEREQLLARKEATLLIRAALLLGNTPVAPSLLQESKLIIKTTTLDDISTTREVKDVKLDPAKGYTYTFPIPERVASVEVTLAGKIDQLTQGGQKQDLSASHQFYANGIDRTELIADAHLEKFGTDYVLEVLGKNGEPQADQPVQLSFQHREFRDSVELSLSTDTKGRVQLGALAGLESVGVELPNGQHREWNLDEVGAVRPGVLHGRNGEVIRLPWLGNGKLSPEQVSLLERRHDAFVRDHFTALSLAQGFLEIKGLPPGDYSLRLRGEEKDIELRITAGTAVGPWLVSPNRQLELRNGPPVQIESVKAEADALLVQLRQTNPYTRVQVAVSRYLPADWRLKNLSEFQRFEPGTVEPSRRPNLFVAGRSIGDEYRYILDRRYTKTYPGNLLTPPGLLLNPWEVRSTDLNAQDMSRSEALRQSTGDVEAKRKVSKQEQDSMEVKEVVELPGTGSNNLDFLANGAPVFYNLTPDTNGVVRIDRKALGDRQYVQVLAEDLTGAVWRSVALPEPATQFQDLRLARGLDPAKPFTEKKEITPMPAGQTLSLADLTTSELETYDSLASVHSLLSTLNGDANFTKFAFVLQWPKLKDEEKRAKYSEFACHELNFFLSRKDPAFFQQVVQPYLKNKKDRTFMDDYLLGADLKRYLEPWHYARLNMAERCLLSQRLPGEAPLAARHLRELWELIPPNPTEDDRLFETALRGRALTPEESASFTLESAKKDALALGVVSGASIAAPASAPMIPGLEPAPVMESIPMQPRATPKPQKSVARESDLEFRAKSFSGGLSLADDAAKLDIAESRRQRMEIRPYYRQLGPTKEWAENNYYQLPIVQQNAELVKINGFWRDYAAWDGKAPFLSSRVAEAAHNFTEMMLALAVLDLPFEAGKHTTKAEGATYSLTAATPLLAVHKQVKSATVADRASELLVSQNFFRADDRYREEGNERLDRYVTDEFLPGVVYGAQLVVTNPTSAPQKIEMLLQIPRGSLPVQGTKPTDSRRLALAGYSTQTLEYFFYFPATGAQPFLHYPVTATRQEQVAGAAKPFTFKVVKQLSQIDTTSWEYVSQEGTETDVLKFLDAHNLARLNLEMLAWRARKSAAFFRQLTALLGKHHLWNEPIYRYALQHNDPAALREWLRHQDSFLAECGPALESTLLTIDPIERRAYEHLEYSPLINQRTHRLGAENKIANPVFRNQYQRYLRALAHRPTLSAIDQLSVVYYLFLQDRVEEALARLATVQADGLPTQLQLDYLRCYAALYEARLGEARQTAAKYASHPVDRWRKLFAEVTAQLDEIEGKVPTRPGDNEPNREAQQTQLASTEPSFELKIENQALALTWKNLTEATVNYYLMDPEFLFSASPFVTEDAGRFSVIRPTQSAKVTLPAGKDTLSVPLPDAFAKANVLVEILAGGQRKAQAHHANTLKLTLAEAYGQLEARDSANKPVTKAYVKVYAKLRGGGVRFFKDGYTDLRGRFDYASLNSSLTPEPPRPMSAATGLDTPMLRPAELGEVERLSMLIVSETNGTVLREVSAPQR